MKSGGGCSRPSPRSRSGPLPQQPGSDTVTPWPSTPAAGWGALHPCPPFPTQNPPHQRPPLQNGPQPGLRETWGHPTLHPPVCTGDSSITGHSRASGSLFLAWILGLGCGTGDPRGTAANSAPAPARLGFPHRGAWAGGISPSERQDLTPGQAGPPHGRGPRRDFPS